MDTLFIAFLQNHGLTIFGGSANSNHISVILSIFKTIERCQLHCIFSRC